MTVVLPCASVPVSHTMVGDSDLVDEVDDDDRESSEEDALVVAAPTAEATEASNMILCWRSML